MEEDIRIGLSRKLLDDRVREGAVDGQIALRPGEVQPVVDVRRLDEAPEVVLSEPEDRVRDDVVVKVVGLRVVRDQPEPVRRAVARGLLQRLGAGFGRHDVVLGAHRARHPGHVLVRDEAPQRGDKAAPAPARAARAVGFT